MRINHNISSMIAQGANYRINQSLSQSLDRLSTGLRINRAADDAAGLSVSEEMRTQVIGGQMAERNISDAIAFLRIADGAMEEVGSLLKRMRDLAVQGANDTLTRTERAYMQKEYDSLRSEIERISKVTQYNGITLFEKNTTLGGDPNFAQGRYGNGVLLGNVPTVGINPLAGVSVVSAEERVAASLAATDDTTGGRVFTFKIGPNATGTKGSASTYDLYNSSDMLNIALPDMSLAEIFLQASFNPATSTRLNGAIFDHRANETIVPGPANQRYAKDGITDVVSVATGATLITANLSCMNTIGIIDGDGNGGLATGAEGTGETHVTGLRRVNTVRSYIGSMINRLEHALSNLRNQNENTQMAESTIRDANFATESSTFTRNQILTQSSTAMLAQANAAPQSILSLLR